MKTVKTSFKRLIWVALVVVISVIITVILGGCLGKPAFAAETGANGEVWMEGNFINQDLYKLSVNAKDIKNSVIGIAFDLLMDSGKFIFLKYEPGNFLEDGGDPIYLVKSDQSKGEVVFGESLTRDDKFPKGSGKIADFYFQVKEEVDYATLEKNVSFGFRRGVVSTFQEIRQDIDQVAWIGIVPRQPEEESQPQSKRDTPLEETIFDSVMQGGEAIDTYLMATLIGLVAALVVIIFFKITQK